MSNTTDYNLLIISDTPMEEKQKGFWNVLKARWYQKGLKYSSLPKTALDIILPQTKDCKTFLDIGSGCGTFAIPLAKAGKKITAIDSSKAMIEILNEEIKKNKIKNIRTINAQWSNVKTNPHDAIICANVPELLKSEGFLKDISLFAKKAVFLIEGADPNADKFYYKELYPILFNKKFPPRSDYLKTYTTLHNLVIFANVNIIDYNFDQPFDDVKEAVEFWKEYLGIVTEEFDEKLKGFLEKKLEKTKNGLIARFKKKSAVIWWRKHD
ncbi:MAG: class I SAM-dependent methyltransferase [Deltaproteobacteria bacterium]|nr:class I SAM-dependent methyltransferase [Deltaproteobacteria bacterium]